MKSAARVQCLVALVLLGAGVRAQEPSLGDVARESKARAEASHQKVLTNDDVVSKAGFFRMYSWSYLTIPQIRLSFLAPVSKDGPAYGSGQYAYAAAPGQNVHFLLGPYLKDDECGRTWIALRNICSARNFPSGLD